MKSLSIILWIPISLYWYTLQAMDTNTEKRTYYYGVSARQGHRKSMEDFWSVTSPLGNDLFIVLCDGHQGARAAQMTAENLPNIFQKKLIMGSSEVEISYIQHLLHESIHEIEESLLHENCRAGTTLACVYLHADRLCVAWLGDTPCYIFKDDKTIYTINHTLERDTEWDRIMHAIRQNGGVGYEIDADECRKPYLFAPTQESREISSYENIRNLVMDYGGIYKDNKRIWRINGSEPTRALGKKDIKKMTPEAIIAIPETDAQNFDRHDVIVIATDGVFNRLKKDVLKELVKKFKMDHISYMCDMDIEQSEKETKKRKYKQLLTTCKEKIKKVYTHDSDEEAIQEYMAEEGDTIYKAFARLIRDQAYDQGSTDNISVIVCGMHRN